jgi:hypothetical protein
MKTAALLATTLVRANHVRSFHVHLAPLAGWEVSEREDQHVVQQQRCTDWHRVERALTHFHRKIAVLLGQGWSEPVMAVLPCAELG